MLYNLVVLIVIIRKELLFMQYGIIDIGSNSIRLAVYRSHGNKITQLFSQKSYSSLISYHENGYMTDDGVEIAINTVIELYSIAKKLNTSIVHILATASLRNIRNKDEIVDAIYEGTGENTILLTGKEEAFFGCMGVLSAFDTRNGICVDLGGGSFEITQYSNREIINSTSIDMGSLLIYEEYVRGLLPSKRELNKIRKVVNASLKDVHWLKNASPDDFYVIGGTGRAWAKLHRGLTAKTQELNGYSIKTNQLWEVVDTICSMGISGVKYLNRVIPERVSTALPGIAILSCISDFCNAKKVSVSKFGLREGYFTSKILKSKGGKFEWENQNKTTILSTES